MTLTDCCACTHTHTLALYAHMLAHMHAQSSFVPDDVSNIIKESIDAVLQNNQYVEAKVGGASDQSQ